jgi:2-polyprenyl-3-methyl-5-hydroxy-6-metoxy-1,4-benzoquinol methylase
VLTLAAPRHERRVSHAAIFALASAREGSLDRLAANPPSMIQALAKTRLRLRGTSRSVAERAAIAVGRRLARLGAGLLLYPHRREEIDLPRKINLEGTSVDIVQDLAEYTGLEREQVHALIRRRHESFRSEWHALPSALHNEDWFYLSSRTYLFANAVHDGEAVADVLSGHLGATSDILDFGGGTGNLALALAARGHRVDFVERSALQKDFVRFRTEKHGFQGGIRVLDQWMPLAPNTYDVVCAIDVLEHLDSLEEILANLLPSIRPGGVLAELSPFVRNTSNPMHHESEATFFRVMQTAGFSNTHQMEPFRLWKASG